MKLETVKNPNEITLPGLRVDVDVVDGNIRGVNVYAPSSSELLLRFGIENYGFRVERLAPPKMVKRHRLTGAILGLKVDELFERITDALLRRDEIIAAGGKAEIESDVEVPDPADDDVADDDDLPF